MAKVRILVGCIFMLFAIPHQGRAQGLGRTVRRGMACGWVTLGMLALT